MALEKTSFYAGFSGAIDAIRKRHYRLLLPIIADALFLSVSAVYMQNAYARFMELYLKLQIVMLSVQNNLVNSISDTASGNSVTEATSNLILQAALVKEQFYMIAKYALVAILLFFLVYCLFQSLSWFLSGSLLKKKKANSIREYMSYLGKFAYASFFFLLVASAIFYFAPGDIVDMYKTNPVMLKALAGTAAIVLGFFALSSYSLLGVVPFREILIRAFTLPFRRMHYLSILFSILLAYVAYMLFSIAFSLGSRISVAVAIAYSFFAMTFSRLLLIGSAASAAKAHLKK